MLPAPTDSKKYVPGVYMLQQERQTTKQVEKARKTTAGVKCTIRLGTVALSVILATWGVEIWRIEVQDQPRKKFPRPHLS
jgi:hypothetical protein